MAYATVDELREYLPQVAAGDPTDALLEEILDRAMPIVDLALGFSFAAWPEAPTATAQDVRADGGPYLVVPAHKTASLTTVYAVTSKGMSYESTDQVTDFEELEDGRLYYDLGWTRNAWYRVTAVWGYGPAPAAIVEVTIEVAVNIWRGRDAAQWSTSIGAEGAGAVSYVRALTWAQRSIIDAVRNEILGLGVA